MVCVVCSEVGEQCMMQVWHRKAMRGNRTWWRRLGMGVPWHNCPSQPIVKYKDNLNIFCFPISGSPNPDNPTMPYSYAYDCSQALALITPLRIPWHPDKGQDFNSTFTYLSFLWDITKKSVTLHDHKCGNFFSCVNNFITSFSGDCCQMLDVMKIHGSLCHIAYIYPDAQ